MNTVEKQKIEKVINADVCERVAAYKAKRSAQRSELQEKLEKNPPATILKMARDAKVAKDSITRLEDAAKKLGWNINEHDATASIRTSYTYDRTGGHYTHEARELAAFIEETAATVAKLEQVGRAFTLKLYAGAETQEVTTLLDGFNKEVVKIIG